MGWILNVKKRLTLFMKCTRELANVADFHFQHHVNFLQVLVLLFLNFEYFDGTQKTSTFFLAAWASSVSSSLDSNQCNILTSHSQAVDSTLVLLVWSHPAHPGHNFGNENHEGTANTDFLIWRLHNKIFADLNIFEWLAHGRTASEATDLSPEMKSENISLDANSLKICDFVILKIWNYCELIEEKPAKTIFLSLHKVYSF